jgi:hypothetical protein
MDGRDFNFLLISPASVRWRREDRPGGVLGFGFHSRVSRLFIYGKRAKAKPEASMLAE